MEEIKKVSNSHVVQKGLTQFKGVDPKSGSRCATTTFIPFHDIPGVMDAGYNPNITAATAAATKAADAKTATHGGGRGSTGGSPMDLVVAGKAPAHGPAGGPPAVALDDASMKARYADQRKLHRLFLEIHEMCMNHGQSWPFKLPVCPKEVPDYHTIIKDPLCLKDVKDRLEKEFYRTPEIFLADLKRICNNCRRYNPKDSIFFSCANDMEAAFTAKLKEGVLALGSELQVK